MKPKDYELTEGTFKCEGCPFDEDGNCLINCQTPSGKEFTKHFKDEECWDAGEPIYQDGEFPDPDERIYMIFKKK